LGDFGGLPFNGMKFKTLGGKTRSQEVPVPYRTVGTDIPKILLLKSSVVDPDPLPHDSDNWIRSHNRIKVINWIQIRIILQMTRQNVRNTYEPI
jgi:hypothetical protein